METRIRRRSDPAVVCISLQLQQTLRKWERTRSWKIKLLPSWRSFWVSNSTGISGWRFCRRGWPSVVSSKGSDVFVAVHVGFMWMLLLVAYGQRDPNAYFLQKHIRESFSKDVSDSMSLGDVFSWSSTVLLKNLFGEYSGERCTLCQLFIFEYPALHGGIKSCCHSRCTQNSFSVQSCFVFHLKCASNFPQISIPPSNSLDNYCVNLSQQGKAILVFLIGLVNGLFNCWEKHLSAFSTLAELN